METLSPPPGLIEQIAQQSRPPENRALDRLVDKLRERYGNAAHAVLFYGSCMRSGDARDGLVDLYVVVDSYRAAYPGLLPALFNRLLPPNVFYLEAEFEGRTLRSKYAVISLDDLERGTSPRWFHAYLWGRFAQPSLLLWTRDEEIADRIHHCLAQAVVTFVTRALPRMPERFDAPILWQRGLALSYATELRAEGSDRSKLLYERHREDYEALTRATLATLPQVRAAEGEYSAEIAPSTRRRSRFTWWLRGMVGKLLNLARLIKAVFTFDGGVDYIAWKLERHSGVHIEVTPRLRRHPLIHCWGVMWRLYRQGVFR